MTDDLSHLDATAQAELVRTGEVSPRELVDAAIERDRARQPASSTPSSRPLFERARAAGAPATLPDGPFRGVPFAAQGPRRPLGRRPVPRGHGVPEGARLDGAGRHRARGAVPRRRARHRRQDQHARARHPAHHRAGGLRADPQPVGHHPLDRRVERRLGGGGGRRARADRPRQRRRRLDPHPGQRVRPGRAQADAGRGCRRARSSAT